MTVLDESDTEDITDPRADALSLSRDDENGSYIFFDDDGTTYDELNFDK
jgi:hypothetical protein